MSVSAAELDRLMERWEELRDSQGSVVIEDLTDDPDMRSALRARIEKLEAMDWLDANGDTIALPTQDLSTVESGSCSFKACVPWMFATRYVLESLIAEGGFGQVWRAWDRRLERRVAVKVSKVDNSAEARHVARLQHPGIVAVHDLGEEQGFWYIVFDLIEGIDLAQRLREDPPDWREAVLIVAQVAGYLQYAHEKGFVHRDVKPANILLKSDGTPVLADFGLALTEADMREETSTTAGTLAYMAPELLTGEGKRADVCTDVYGLGVVLFQSVTGELPFTGRNFCQIRKRILSGELPPFPQTVEPIPDRLREITLRCIAKDPDMRYQSAGELARELKEVIKPMCIHKI